MARAALLARAATPAAAVAALAAGLALGWATSRPAAVLAGHGRASPGASAASLAIGALAVLVAASNGFAKAYSP